jgi:ketosteroid isomerase-like protein
MALALLAVSAGAVLGQKSSKAEDAVLAADAAWLKVYAAKDLDKSVAFCDEQVSMLVSNVPIATGKDAVRKLIADDFASGDLIWHANKAGVARSGDLGYTVGTYDLKMKDASGNPVFDKGKFLTVWKNRWTAHGRCCSTCSIPTCRPFPTRLRPSPRMS